MTSLNIPEPSSRTLMADLRRACGDVSRATREKLFMNMLLAGDVPSWMRSTIGIAFDFNDKDGDEHRMTIEVLPDYLTIGGDDDNLRVPLFPGTAQFVADAWECMLPTTNIVDAVWRGVGLRMDPMPWGPPYDTTMMSMERFFAHDACIKARTQDVNLAMGIAGHKKDIVITNLLKSRPKHVAIYGMHNSGGGPTQPLYLGHDSLYADYSHGIRLVSKTCVIDNEDRDLIETLCEPTLCTGVSREGPLQVLGYST